MRLILFAAAGGAIGSTVRYLINTGSVRLLGAHFPWATLVINISGSFLMGLLSEMILLKLVDARATDARIFVLTGILGGYTTFSAFSLDVYLLVQREMYGWAAFYLLGSVVLSLLALLGGLALARTLGQ
jgi:fluoride exporter